MTVVAAHAALHQWAVALRLLTPLGSKCCIEAFSQMHPLGMQALESGDQERCGTLLDGAGVAVVRPCASCRAPQQDMQDTLPPVTVSQLCAKLICS